MHTTDDHRPVSCLVLRSVRRELTYLYLRDDLTLDDIPAPLQNLFAGAEIAMRLELTPERQLAKEDIGQVLANLADPGYHLQLPPEDDPSGWLDLPRQDRS